MERYDTFITTPAVTEHATKAGARLATNTLPEPFSNWIASLYEEQVALGELWTVPDHPVIFVVFLSLFIFMVIYLPPKLWLLIKMVCQKLRHFNLNKKSDLKNPEIDEDSLRKKAELNLLLSLKNKGFLTDHEYREQEHSIIHKSSSGKI